ncbi:hypothetical protein EYF80_014253 [Liparis tanakae]|uniref:Uncharacterized protein n=1 Tax=Liparis tanakae TaxID=230148 RepID=A0A4Z2ICI0_9TELE|nr:hypothetical protein EYF80_014253 [Liparis tanakae]
MSMALLFSMSLRPRTLSGVMESTVNSTCSVVRSEKCFSSILRAASLILQNNHTMITLAPGGPLAAAAAGGPHMLVFLMMRPWSIFWPMPCTTNTMCVVSGGVSSWAASST